MPVTTRLSLITRISDSEDSASWSEFVNLYGPFVYAIGRGRGLQDADACDLVQDVMREVAKSVDRFDTNPELGKFRSWLSVITRRALMRLLEKRQKQAIGTGDTANVVALSNTPTPEDEEFWEREHQRHLFHWAAERVKGDFTETTWRAFWLTAVDGLPATEAANQCGVTVGAVYIAKSRVASRLREKISQATA
ncbi:MAG: sigma-70 family RNA polymerase sigma factor [Planctomycetota bacterium]